MRLNLPKTELWSSQNQIYQQALGLAEDPRFSVQIYTSVSHALGEVCSSLSDLIPHKRTVAHFSLMGPDFDSVAVSLSKKELTLKSFKYDEISAPEYFTPLAKDLLMLVTCFDDPVTAARHDFLFLEERLKEKKYFHIKLSNFLHSQEPLKLPTHYEVLVLSLTADRTLVIAGERAKLKPDFTPKLSIEWDADESVLSEVQKLRFLDKSKINEEEIQKKRAKILSFEKDLPKGISAFFSADASRVFDRSVLTCEGVDGLSAISRLGENLETTSLCRHFDQKMFQHLVSQGHSLEKLRGTILIDEKQVSPDFKKLLAKVYADLLKEQHEVLNF